MKSIEELIVRTADLVEAEGRVARRNAVRVLSTAVIFLSASALTVSGVIALCAAAFLGLNSVMHAGWALAIVSLPPLGAGVVCGYVAVLNFRNDRRIR